MCRKLRERRKNYVSASVSRSICESAFVQSTTAVKRKLLVPKKHHTQSGLVVHEPVVRQTEQAEKLVLSFLAQEFNGTVAEVKTCGALFKCRHALFSIQELVDSIYRSYDSPDQQVYRVKFYNENTGEEIVGLHNMKICIDACMRMSCGAASQGGDTKITNVVLQDASFPLSIGRTEHSFLLGTLNCGESDQWLKYALFLWAQEAGFLEKNHNLMKGRKGELTRFWLVGDLKLLDWLYCGGGLSC
jgi:hypothetical protein